VVLASVIAASGLGLAMARAQPARAAQKVMVYKSPT